MCGILAVISRAGGKTASNLKYCLNRLEPRGPDNFKIVEHGQAWLGFRRLSIMDTSSAGDQPFTLVSKPTFEYDGSSQGQGSGQLHLICNGEIYNYKELIEPEFKLRSGSDCEVILHLFAKYGPVETFRRLDGVFALVIYNSATGEVWAARDPYGIRPMFFCAIKSAYWFASELKAISRQCPPGGVQQFPPGYYFHGTLAKYRIRSYYRFEYSVQQTSEAGYLHRIRTVLERAVAKRIMSDRPVGALLSGGVDSSLICALVNRHFPTGHLQTFSIGLKGSTDLKYADMVAKHLSTKHYRIELSTQDFLGAIDAVIYATESWDTTTVRASVGNYLVGKYIAAHSDCKVIFNGDGSDEMGGYIYLAAAPTPKEFQAECEELVHNIHYFDVLRSDRSMAAHGLEARTPFLDKTFVRMFMSIPAELRMHDYGKDPQGRPIEKYLLRKAFEGSLLPAEVLWRRKEAFSDGVSSTKNSWYAILQKYIDTKISDEEFETGKMAFDPQPELKESYYYRLIFEKHFPRHGTVIPRYWMPKWSKTNDPSARTLTNYSRE